MIKKIKLVSLPKLLKKTQDVFNAWIRKRDLYACCISCESFNTAHASHYFSAGSYSALRFNEMNVNSSCVKCNTFLHGNLINYRKGLIKKYGEVKVKELELSADLRKVRKWSRFELEQLLKIYK